MYATEYELVVRLLEYYFGRAVAKVGGAILLRGQVTLHRLMIQAHLDFNVVRNSILILLHHGFLEYSLQRAQPGERRGVTVYYSICCEHVLSYPLLPFGCLLVKSELGSLCYEVLMLVSERGTISHRHLCQLSCGRHSVSLDEVKRCISQLLECGVLTTCNSYHHRMMSLDVTTRGCDSGNDPLSAMNSTIYHIMQGEELTGPAGPLLRVNSSIIVDKLLKEEIVSLVCKRVGDMPMIRAIMKGLLTNPQGQWPMLVECSVLEKRVLGILDTNFGQKSTGEQVTRLLNALNKHPDNLVQYDASMHSYFLDWSKVKLMLRKKAILGCVRQLCGPKSARIWNLLASENANNSHVTFDAHKVSTQALVSVQTARSILYQLSLRGFVTHHEADAVGTGVPAISTSDRHVLSFSSSVESTYLQIMKNTFKFVSNLLERLEHEKLRIFQRFFIGQDKPGDNIETDRNECDIVEVQLLHVLKFVVLMQNL